MSRLGSVLTRAAEDGPITFDVDDIRRRVVRRRRFRRAAGTSVGVLLVAATVALVVPAANNGGHERIDAVGSPEDVRLVGRWTPIAYSEVTVGAEGVFIEFGADGWFNGFNGCNGFGGSWRLDGDRLNVGEITQNKNACDPSEVIAPIAALLDGDPKVSVFDDQPGSLQLTSGSAFIGFERATDPAQAMSARIELASTTVAAGETLSGRLVVFNNTGRDLKVIGCGSIFQVALANDAVEPEIVWNLCAQEITVPEGESTYPVSVQARRATCTTGPAPSSTPTCEPDGSPPPLPPGNYEARLYQSTAVVPDPPPVDVRVTG